ncbi:GNAT family N-acetyltransferase [Nonomuraea ferruginea]
MRRVTRSWRRSGGCCPSSPPGRRSTGRRWSGWSAPRGTRCWPRGPGGVVVGLLTLVVYPLASGVRARIEDVVVDGAARGQGVGGGAHRAGAGAGQGAGARTVDLTSRPEREAANRLYERAGFRRRDTASYRVIL